MNGNSNFEKNLPNTKFKESPTSGKKEKKSWKKKRKAKAKEKWEE